MATFLSFGSTAYTHSLARIRSQALVCPFNAVICVSEDDLKSIPEFWDKHGSFIESNPRGFGYWIWKSYLTWKTLRDMPFGDVLVYADAGCTLHPNTDAYNELFKAIKESDGIAAGTLNYPEHKYCKMDLAIALSAKQHIHTNQLHATFFALKQTPANVLLAKQWYDTMCEYHLIDDSPSVEPNTSDFIEHRHDQSVFSLLRKIRGVSVQLQTFPIVDTRIRS